MDKSLPANAGDMGSIPGPGRFHVLWSSFIRALKLLNLRAAAADSVLTAGEASSEKPPLPATRERPQSTQDPALPKINKIVFKSHGVFFGSV